MTESGAHAHESAGRRLGELVGLFGRLGFTAFGGPAAHIAMMHDEVVTRRRWMDDQRFIDLIGVTNLIPGPNSTEMTMRVGHHRGGWRGLVTAGTAFILPAALIVGGLTRIPPHVRDRAWSADLLDGVNAAALGLMAGVLAQLGGYAVVDPLTAALAIAAGLALWRTELNSAWLVLAGAAAGIAANAASIGP